MAVWRTRWGNDICRERTIWKVTDNPMVSNRETHGGAMKTTTTLRSREYWAPIQRTIIIFGNFLDDLVDVL